MVFGNLRIKQTLSKHCIFILFCTYFSLLSSIKATGTLIAGVALLFLYFDVFKKIDIKFFILLFFIYLLLLSLVSYENF